ncbi:pilus assembly protein PilP [Aestuariibacter salexigens]|uniref:pilus assembly protein PilP n=1 Tax=Aestuariibacter salexigens TaxID=226010 RepID=UPI0004108DD3|nr:pilus assembly protein PilP [Aestuariibacter salexigens]
MKKWLIIATVLLLAGCKGGTEDLRQYTEQVKANTQVSIEPYPEFKTMPAFEYAAQELRSPFTRPRNQQVEQVTGQQANCLQPDFSRQKEPLEQYGIDALSMAGMFTSQGTQWILVKANDGSLYKATVGNHIGLFFGEITSIQNGKVAITEMLPDGAGCWQKKQTTLTMSSTAGESNNV